MGQNYSEKYKKSYKEDYVKSYKKERIYEAPPAERQAAEESVAAEGHRRVSRPEPKVKPVDRKPKVEVKTVEVESKPKVEVKDLEIESKPENEVIIEIKPKPRPAPQSPADSPYEGSSTYKEETPPPFDLLRQQLKKDSETADYPVEHLHGNTYLNVFTGREISEARAREILLGDGFRKKNSMLMPILFFCILLMIFFGYFGIVITALCAVMLFKRENTGYTKIKNLRSLSFTMPATSEDKMLYKQEAGLCLVVAIIGIVVKAF